MRVSGGTAWVMEALPDTGAGGSTCLSSDVSKVSSLGTRM